MRRTSRFVEGTVTKSFPPGLQYTIVYNPTQFIQESINAVIETIGEATILAARHGVPAETLLEVLTSSLFSAPVYKNYGAIIAGRNYRPPGFRLALGLKDIRLALAAGEGARVPLPFASVLRDAFLEAVAHGDADLDWAAVAEVARRRAGSEDGAGMAQRA